MKLTYEIDGGYVGARPHCFTVDMSVLEDWDFENDSFADFLDNVVEPEMQDDFAQFYPYLTEDSFNKLKKEYNKLESESLKDDN